MAVDVVGGRGRTPALSLVAAPTRTSLQWLDPAAPNVPVVVTATGPRVMRIAGRHTDDVLLAVGAERQRISWGIGTIREAAANAGRDPNELRFGALLTVVPLNDIRAACDLAAASVASVARFSTMYGQRPGGPVSGAARKVYERLASTYDMTQHAQPGSPQTAALTAEFIKEFAVIGSPERCIERLIEIAEEGVTRFVLVPPAVEELVHPRGRAEALGFERARRVLASELLPLARERILG